MGCLYFIPARRFEGGRVPDVVKARRLAAEGEVCLEDLGLGHLDGAALTYRGVRNNGPDGGAGLVIGLGVDASATGIFKGKQAWNPGNGGDLYLGWNLPEGDSQAGTPAPPGPDAFLRIGALEATASLVLADGNRWGFLPTKALPEVMRFNSAGEVTYVARDRDAAHFAASEWLYDYLTSLEERPYMEVMERVATCLNARYHMSTLELIGLGLFSTDLLLDLVCACLGIDADKVRGKKNEDP